MSMTDNLVEAAADLGRINADIGPKAVDSMEPLLIERVRADEDIRVVSLEQHLGTPLRTRGTAIVNDPADFAQYVNRLVDPAHSTLWADINANSVTAVLDDHADAECAGWRSHTVHLALQVDADWAYWARHNGQLMTQEMFAEFLEEVAHTVVTPDAATLMEVATTFRAKRGADFAKSVRLQSGDVAFSYQEETKASAGLKGEIEVPEVFTVRVTPWLGTDAVELTARLRYRLDGGSLALGYSLLRPDRAKQTAFDLILGRLREDVDIDAPMFKGSAPSPVKPTA